MKKLMTLLALTTLTACDFSGSADFQGERSSHAYQEAMTDYQAGRLDAALQGLERVARDEPGNASARFQLACLLQDVRKDYLGAVCAYHEYLLRQPESDKAKTARERYEFCLRELATDLADRYKLIKDTKFGEQVALLQKELKESKTQQESLQQELAASRARAEGLAAERQRLLATIRGDAVENPDRPQIADVKDLLNEMDSVDTPPLSATAQALLRESDADATASLSGDLAQLEGTGRPVVKTVPPPPEGPKHEPRPEIYVVQEGDTLRNIAKRFYGRADYWKRIQEANKAFIPISGDIKIGARITLP